VGIKAFNKTTLNIAAINDHNIKKKPEFRKRQPFFKRIEFYPSDY